MVLIEIKEDTLAILLAGLYTIYSQVDVLAIPSSVYIEIASQLLPYLDKWDYDIISFEDWIRYCLMIYPKVMYTADELDEIKDNELYIELVTGNIILVATASIPFR